MQNKIKNDLDDTTGTKIAMLICVNFYTRFYADGFLCVLIMNSMRIKFGVVVVVLGPKCEWKCAISVSVTEKNRMCISTRENGISWS